jgi:multiple sugar transport system permease protein/raffinose/stachyose/melibiose transport system permease protein
VRLTRRRRTVLLSQLSTLVLLCVFLFPYVWMVSSSFKTAGEIFAIPPRFLPAQPTLDNFARIVGRPDIQRFFLNSILVAAVTVTLNLTLGSAAAFALAMCRFTGRRALTMLTLVTQLFPAVIVVIPLYRLWASLELLNSYQALIFTYVAVTLPLGIWMLSGYMRTIPYEIVEAAIVDGCGRLRLFADIVLPLARPGIAATAVYVTLVSWNEFIYAVTFTSAKEMRTVSAGLYGFLGEFVYDFHLMLAMAVLMAVPVAVVFLFLQRFLVQGLTAGATKG